MEDGGPSITARRVAAHRLGFTRVPAAYGDPAADEALADEHYWFRCVVGGETFDFGPEEPNAEWQVEPGESAEDIFSLYRDEIERANAIIAATSLDTAPRQLDPRWGEWGKSFTSLRIVMLHVLKETACHAGHLDAVSELLDGRQWIVLDDR